MRIRKLSFGVLLISTSLIFFTSCGNERVGCEGEIVVENPIPDTTLYVGGEPFFMDLFAPPVVLRQTEGKNIVTTFLVDDLSIIEASRERSTKTGRLNALKITPLKEGSTTVRIQADDGCGQIETSFNVTVLDTTQQ